MQDCTKQFGTDLIKCIKSVQNCFVQSCMSNLYLIWIRHHWR